MEQLGRVNPIHLDGEERLAFWINIYNALMMHVGYLIQHSLFSFGLLFSHCLCSIDKSKLETRPRVTWTR